MSAARGAFQSKRWRIVVVVAGIVLLGGLAVYLTAPREPTYGGKSLSWWLHQNDDALVNLEYPNRAAVFKESKHAIKSIGTNAIPTLLKWSRSPDSRLKSTLNSFLNMHPFITFRFHEGYESWQAANRVFYILGNDGTPAIPALTALLESPIEMQRELALDSILAIDHDRKVLLPIIVEALQRTNGLQFSAALYIHNTYPEQAEKLGVYKVAPRLRRLKVRSANVVSTNAPSESK